MPDRSTDMYPPSATHPRPVGGVSSRSRARTVPGHFEGVATVVTKLLWAADPDRAYFGQKDAQQVAVVKRLAADLDIGRRDRRLSRSFADAGRAGRQLAQRVPRARPSSGAALSLSRSLRTAAEMYASGERDTGRLRARIHEVLAAEPLVRIDYAELVDPSTFRAPGTLAVLAVKVGKTRLIDNHDVSKPFPG